VVDIYAGHCGETVIGVCSPVTAAYGVPKLYTGRRSRPAGAPPVTVSSRHGAIFVTAALFVRTAGSDDTFAFIVDVYAGKGGNARIRICPPVAPAYRIPDHRTDLRAS
jgi:hypothetical protein